MRDLVLHADVRTGLLQIPDESVHCVITSPPYFGLRKYVGVEPSLWGVTSGCDHVWGEPGRPFHPGQIPQTKWTTMTTAAEGGKAATGQYCLACNAWRGTLGNEPTPEQYCANIVEVFREVRRVLRADGTCWINIGDSYCTGTAAPRKATKGGQINNGYWTNDQITERVNVAGIPAKNALLIPDRLRIALQDDGWYVRVRSMPWVKRSALPGSQTDRPTVTTEDWFMLTKSARYFWDAFAVRRPNSSAKQMAHQQKYKKSYAFDDRATATGQPGNVNNKGIHQRPGTEGRTLRTSDAYFDTLDGLILEQESYLDHLRQVRQEGGMLLDPQGDPLALDIVSSGSDRKHYAAYPEKLVEPLVLAGTSEGGVCSICGAPQHRILLKTHNPGGEYTGFRSDGWRPSCVCGAPDGWRPDDLEIIETPTGERVGDDPSLLTGRAGYNRPRDAAEGTRPMTRYEQRQYARQLKVAVNYQVMRDHCGSAWEHYVRTDRSGARPLPPDLLHMFLAMGWLTEVVVPTWTPPPVIPATVLDPFLGSGTTLSVAKRLGRSGVGIEASAEYVAMSQQRLEATVPAPLVA